MRLIEPVKIQCLASSLTACGSAGFVHSAGSICLARRFNSSSEDQASMQEEQSSGAGQACKRRSLQVSAKHVRGEVFR
jgi:hypothetical protein